MSHEIIGICESRTMAEGLGMVLQMEDIPTLVEPVADASGNMMRWCVKVPGDAREDALRILAERREMGGEVDWEQLDIGDPSPDVAAVLRARPATHAFTSGLRWVGAMAGFLMLGAAILGIVMALIG